MTDCFIGGRTRRTVVSMSHSDSGKPNICCRPNSLRELGPRRQWDSLRSVTGGVTCHTSRVVPSSFCAGGRPIMDQNRDDGRQTIVPVTPAPDSVRGTPRDDSRRSTNCSTLSIFSSASPPESVAAPVLLLYCLLHTIHA